MAIQKISNAVIANDAVSADNIATGAITVADIPDGEITNAKIDTVAASKVTGEIGTSQIADAAVTDAKINTVASTKVTGKVQDNEDLPTIRPSLLLDFANQKTLDPRIDFSRNSTATYYDGKTFVKAEENLLTYSQDFSNSIWEKQSVTIVSTNNTAPDGTSTATLITDDAESQYHQLDLQSLNTSTTGTHTASIYVKAAGRTQFYIYANFGTAYSQKFNISSGTTDGYFTGGTQAPSSTINALSDNWYRISITFNKANVSGQLVFALYNATGNFSSPYVGDGSSGAYVWGAQFSKHDTVSTYIQTTSHSVAKYQPKLLTAGVSQARFDHDPVTGESLGLMLEQSRANSHLSNTFEFDYNGGHASRILNQGIAPDGTHTAAQIIEATTNAAHAYDAYTTFPSTGIGTASMFVKAIGHVKGVSLAYYDAFGGQTIQTTNFKLIGNGEASNSSGAIKYLGNGWYRISRTWESIANNGPVLRIGLLSGTNESTYGTASYFGDGWSGILIWGTQQEAGPFMTSYIPNVVGGSQVTRQADKASIAGNNFTSWYRQDEGSFIFDFDGYGSGNYSRLFGLTNNDNYANRMTLYKGASPTATTEWFFETRVNNTSYSQITLSPSGSQLKIGLAYADDDVAISLDGNNVLTSADAPIPTVEEFEIGAEEGASVYNGYYKKIAYYPKRLTNAQLQALTEE